MTRRGCHNRGHRFQGKEDLNNTSFVSIRYVSTPSVKGSKCVVYCDGVQYIFPGGSHDFMADIVYSANSIWLS